MFDRQWVRAHVNAAVMKAFIPPFTAETFTFDIVPGAKPPKGIGAKELRWAEILNGIAEALRKLPVNPGYGGLTLKQGDARRTVDKPLHETVDLLVERILELEARPLVAALDRQAVRSDTATAVRQGFVPPFSAETFTFELVPGAEPPKGAGDGEKTWADRLNDIAAALRDGKVGPGYGALVLKQGDARRTYGEQLHKTVDLLVDRILESAAITTATAAGGRA